MVWDEAYGKASHGDVALRYVPGTAKIFSNGAVNGQALSDNLFKNGTPLGYDKLDGNLPGCNQSPATLPLNLLWISQTLTLIRLFQKQVRTSLLKILQ